MSLCEECSYFFVFNRNTEKKVFSFILVFLFTSVFVNTFHSINA